MVSSGISGNITSVRTVEASAGVSTKKSNADFGMIMTQSLANNTQQMEMQFEASEIKETQFSPESVSQSAGNAQKDKIQRNTNSEKTDDVSGQKVQDELKDSPKLEEAVDKIKEKIKEKFGVTDEDIEKALEVLGLTMADLLQLENLTDFVVELTGMESSVELLVSSEISTKLDELAGFINDTMQDLANEFGISQEELADLLQDAELERLKENEEILFDEEVVNSENTDAQDTVEAVEVMDESEDVQKNISVKENVENADVDDAGLQTGIKVTRPEAKEFSSNENTDLFKGEQPSDMTNGIVNNLTNAVNEAFEVRGLNEMVDSVRIMEQIIETAKVTLNQEVSSMEFMLNPENLGKVNLTVSVKAGVVTASIVAQNEVVREAIESQIVMLKENLSSQGIKVEAVEVTVESHAFEAGAQNGQNNAFNEQHEEAQRKNSRPLRLDSLNDLVMEDLTEEERIVLDMMAEEGNQVNFTA